jgi:hypothetical protein
MDEINSKLEQFYENAIIASQLLSSNSLPEIIEIPPTNLMEEAFNYNFGYELDTE